MPELSPYQVVARDRLLSRERYGLFDEQGVGKTQPLIVAASAMPGPRLITVPAFLMANWKRELSTWAPGATVGVADGERNQRLSVLHGNSDFILTTYHSWLKFPELQSRKWGVMAWDEAHRLRGRNSQWTKKTFQLRNSDNKNRDGTFWFLTGTPLVRDGGDVWPFLHMMDRQMYRGYWAFVERHCRMIVTPWAQEVGHVLHPAEFAQEMRRYSIRRLCRQIPELASLEHVDEDIYVQLPPDVQREMRQAKKTYELYGEAIDGSGALFAKLWQMTTLPGGKSPKLEALVERIEPLNSRIIVYVWFRKSGQAVVDALKKTKRPVVMITGDVPTARRDDYVQQFNEKSNCVLVGTIAAMKEGLNLQASNQIFFVEESPLPSDNEQAIARAKRRGQTKTVHVTHLLCERSPDTAIHRVAEKRQTDINRALMRELMKQMVEA